jgi:hypothetical protein
MIAIFRKIIPAFFFFALIRAATAAAPQPVAIIYELEGEALRQGPGSSPQPVELLDRLAAGTSVELAAGSRLALAFVTGRRYEISGPARATLGKGDLAARSGGVRALPSVPPLPRLAPIAETDRPGLRAGAVRIRAERMTGLYPHGGAAVLPGEIRLRFQPVTGAARYRVEVQDEHGRTVFREDGESSVVPMGPTVKLPAGTLHAGASYRWTVRTLDRPGAVARGAAGLVVLDEETARRREETRKVLASEGPGALPLLAAIDAGLGLWLEAREALTAALDAAPGEPALQEALAAIERRLETEDDAE